MRLSHIFITSILFAAVAAGQQKLAVLDEKNETTTAFVAKIREATRKIKTEPENTKLFLAFSPRDLENSLILRKASREIISEMGLKSEQVRLTHPQATYTPEIVNTELWILPPGSEAPYKSLSADCFCWGETISKISGMPDVDKRTERVFFATPSVDWWPERFTTYKWSISGGTIEEGANTNKIVVRPSKGNRVGIEVKLEIELYDEMCRCPQIGTFTTKFRP
jgi:hypothetical protein